MFSYVCSEQAIANPVPNLFQTPSNQLRKALLVANFVHEGLTGDVELINAAEIEFEYFA